MAEIYVAKSTEMGDGDRRIICVDDNLEIGVFRRDGAYYAYANRCVHQGGPACEGLIMSKVEDIIAPDGTFRGQRFSKDEIHFVCPWHGYEYDLKTGECAPDRSLRLRKFDVIEKAGDIYVRV